MSGSRKRIMISKKTRRKMSEDRKGEKNPMYGKHPPLKPRNTSFRRRKNKNR